MNQEQIWNNIAPKWNKLKTKPFTPAVKFLKNKKGNILDLGCGSGRNFVKINGIIYGLDFSKNMIKYAKENTEKKKIKVKLKQMKNNKISFKDDFFDAAICIALLHCMKKTEQKKILKELYRVMKSNSKTLISVWSKNHRVLKNKPKECFVNWNSDGKVLPRYTYTYNKKELEQQLKKTGFRILKSKEDENIIVIVEK